MKVLKWLFNFSTRHHMDTARYERHGKLSRVLVLIFVPIFMALGVGCIYFAGTIDSNIIIKFCVIAVATLFALTCAEYCGVYSFCGFVCFLWGSIESFAKRKDKKRQATQRAVNSSASEGTSQQDDLSTKKNLEAETPILVTENVSEESNKTDAKDDKSLDKTLDTTQTTDKKPVSKWLDLAVGIYCLVFALAGVAGSVVMFLHTLSLL